MKFFSRVTGPLCGEFTGHRWIPLTKASDDWANGWANNRHASDFRRPRAHYDVTVMKRREVVVGSLIVYSYLKRLVHCVTGAYLKWCTLPMPHNMAVFNAQSDPLKWFSTLPYFADWNKHSWSHKFVIKLMRWLRIGDVKPSPNFKRKLYNSKSEIISEFLTSH